MTEFVTIDLPDGRKAKLPKGMTRAQMAEALNSFPSEPGGVSVNSEAIPGFKGRLSALDQGLNKGVSFGFNDNIAGARDAVLGIGDDSTMGERYTQGRDNMRASNNAAQEAYPSVFNTGQVAGATAVGAAAGPVATGRSLLGTMGRGMAIGGLEGGMHGGGNADGQDMAEQIRNGALIGMGAGALAPGIVGLASRGKDILTGGVDAVTNRVNKGKAARAVGDVVRQSGRDVSDITSALQTATREGQPEYRLMDATGIAGQRAASGLTRSGGDAATEIAEYLQRRQADQGDRVGGFVEDSFGVRGTTAAKRTGELTEARSSAAYTAYDAAKGNAAPVDIRGALGVIDDRIGGMSGSGISGDGIDGKLSGYRRRLAGDGAGLGDDVTSAELSDFDRVLGVKQSIQDDIGAAVRAGRNNEARELGKLAQELDSALEQSSDMYRSANDGFREASRVIESVPEGAQMATRGRAADNVPRFQSMTPDQQGAARVGYGDKLLDQLERVTAPTSNRAKPLQSTKREVEAGAMSLDPALYGRRLSRENEMWETQNRALGGSRTADNLADQSAMEGLAGGALDVARSGANMQFGDTAAKIAGLIGPLAKGQNDATRQAIARALLSKDPARELAPLLRKDMQSQATKRAIESLLRNTGVQSSRQ